MRKDRSFISFSSSLRCPEMLNSSHHYLQARDGGRERERREGEKERGRERVRKGEREREREI